MKTLLVALCMAFTLAGTGAGCSALQTHSTEAITAASPAVKVQYAIDQINASIAAAAQTVLAQTHAGAISKVDERKYAADLAKLSQAVDVAQATLTGGDPTSASGQLQLVQSALNILQNQLIAAAAKGK